MVSTATVSPKCKMVGTTQQTPKPSQTIAEINAHVSVKHVFTVLRTFFQLTNSLKIFILFVLLLLAITIQAIGIISAQTQAVIPSL